MLENTLEPRKVGRSGAGSVSSSTLKDKAVVCDRDVRVEHTYTSSIKVKGEQIVEIVRLSI